MRGVPQDCPRFRLEDGDEVYRLHVRLILAPFLLGQFSLVALVCQSINTALQLRVGSQVSDLFCNSRSKASSNGLQHSIENRGFRIHWGYRYFMRGIGFYETPDTAK